MHNVWDSYTNLYTDYLSFFKKLNVENIDVGFLNKFDQIHAGGIKSTEKLAQKAELENTQKILELGGGIGGVARFLEERYGVNVVNLDLSKSYSYTGKKLTDLCKTTNKIHFVIADAVYCPLKDNIFDVVWLQHVNMNISNKDHLFSEIRRVLKVSGSLVFHEWFLSYKSAAISLPLIWADTENYNHLCTFEEFNLIANRYGFDVNFIDNETKLSLAFYKKLLSSMAFKNPIFVGRDSEKIFKNTAKMIVEGKLSVYSGKFTLREK